MSSPKRLLTAKKKDGTEITTTYEEWADINKCTKSSIQKRVSHRKQQIEREGHCYSMEQVVGTVKLSRQSRYMKKKRPIDEVKKSAFEMRKSFLSVRLA